MYVQYLLFPSMWPLGCLTPTLQSVGRGQGKAYLYVAQLLESQRARILGVFKEHLLLRVGRAMAQKQAAKH
jgi:hypothetical protein